MKKVNSAVLIYPIAALLIFSIASLLIGAKSIPPSELWDAFLGRANPEATMILSLRLPRTIMAILIGLGLGLAGALMQALTRNPIADPGLLGVNAGAALAIVLGIAVGGLHSPYATVVMAFAGAMAAALGVQFLGSRSGATPLQLTLAGIALSSVLGGITSAVLFRDPELFRRTLGWGAGSLVITDTTILYTVAPVLLLGAFIAIIVARSLDSVVLGDDMAKAMGVNLGRTRLLTLIALTALSGAATAAAGPIAFIGLMVPHAVRYLTGPNIRLLLLGSALSGPVLLIAADIIARVVLREGELPVGLVTSAMGAPILIILARRGGRLNS